MRNHKMNTSAEARRRSPDRRPFRGLAARIFVLLMVFCVALSQVSPALAKKASKKKKSKTTITYTPVRASTWRGGTWEDGCYINSKGVVKAALASEDKKEIPKIKGLKGKKYLFIGASRTSRAAKFVKDNQVFFYPCGGATFRWFFRSRHKKKPAYQVIRAYIKANPRGTVIIDMGGNDLSNIKAYIGFYQDLIEKYPRVKFYFRGILPREIGNNSNAARLKFNEKLEEALPGHVINLFEKVYRMKGFYTVDGTHYSARQTRKVYQLTMEKIGRKISVNLSTGKVSSKK